MTTVLAGDVIALRLEDSIPGSVKEWNASDVWIKPESILEVCSFLKEDTARHCNYLLYLLYTSDATDDTPGVHRGGRSNIKKKNTYKPNGRRSII